MTSEKVYIYLETEVEREGGEGERGGRERERAYNTSQRMYWFYII